MYPLSFSEYFACCHSDWTTSWQEYMTYGGLPYLFELDTKEEKINYLTHLFAKTYLQDIIDRHKIRSDHKLSSLVDILASGIGSLTNPVKLSRTFKNSHKSIKSAPTIRKYLDYLEEAFLIKEVKRYDVKGRKYMTIPQKYYFEDIGLRNARLNFRQIEETHLMENAIFNELRYRGYHLNGGVVELNEKMMRVLINVFRQK